MSTFSVASSVRTDVLIPTVQAKLYEAYEDIEPIIKVSILGRFLNRYPSKDSLIFKLEYNYERTIFMLFIIIVLSKKKDFEVLFSLINLLYR